MLQKAFDIHAGNIAKHGLCIEVGDEHIILSSYDENNIASRNLEYYLFYLNDNFTDVLSQLFQQSILIKEDYHSIKIIWENARAVYIPEVFAKDEMDKSFYNFIENSLSKQKQLSVKNDLFSIAYLADENKWNLLHKKFSNAIDSHKYAEILNKKSSVNDAHTLHFLTIFYPKHFVVVTVKNNQLQFINSVNFSSATDVVYYLLNAAKQLNTSISETLLTISGLVDGNSNLFKEIYKYIPNIDVDAADNASFLKDNFGEYPSHFFVPFFKYV